MYEISNSSFKDECQVFVIVGLFGLSLECQHPLGCFFSFASINIYNKQVFDYKVTYTAR